MQLRGLASSVDAGKNWDLRCGLREGLIDWLQREHPESLPRARAEATVALEGDALPARDGAPQ